MSRTPLAEVKASVLQCKDHGRWPTPYCTYDSGDTNPWWLQEGDTYAWYEWQDGSLNLGGLSIPLTVRYILCPVHAHYAQEREDVATS